GISTLAAIAHDPLAPTSTLKVYAAAGTHLNPELALVRALIELAQHRAQIIYRELVQGLSGGPTYCFKRFKTIEDVSFLLNGHKVLFDNLNSFSHPDFKVEIEHLLNTISKKGFEVFIVETTHPVLKLPAVIITIPSARLNRPSTKLHPYLLIARQLMDIRKYKDALRYMEETFEKEPSYQRLPQILCQAAVCAKMAGDYQKAVLYYEKAAEVSPHLFRSEKFVADFTEALSNIKE
ncbi:MAG TPA: hypothetical protein ENF30_02370, partial [Candidatus Desulfofervidus auxilii]|nr:hypothetical protein [Candidatus Desulfofervidus auxilii]